MSKSNNQVERTNVGTLKEFREVLKELKHKKLGKPALKLCPKCGNPEIKFSSGLDTYPRMYGITPQHYVCEKCGYRGPVAMELEEEENS